MRMISPWFSYLVKCTLALTLLLTLNSAKLDLGITTSSDKSREVIVIHNTQIPRSDKEALIILPGFGDSKSGRKHQTRFFENVGYDLFIPDYVDRESFEGTVEKFHKFYVAQNLEQYDKVHVFSYILGAWVINTFINKYGAQNIGTIIYDRSPLQERAPKVVEERLPRIGRMVAGKVLKDLSLVSYPSIAKNDVRVGILVESKATPLIRRFKKTALSYGSIDWKNLDFNQDYDDLIYTRLNHDELYYSFEEIGPDILHFLKKGTFTKDARREPFDWDPFKKYKKERDP